MLTKPSTELTLFDTLSRLTFVRPRNSWVPMAIASSPQAASTTSISPRRSNSIGIGFASPLTPPP
jgi:hypothetical protein